MPADRCLHAALGGYSGPGGPRGGAAQSAATRLRRLASRRLRPRLCSGLRPQRWTRCPLGHFVPGLPLRGRSDAGSRASLGARGFAPQPLSARWGGPALARRDALRAPLRGGCAVAARRHAVGSPSHPAMGRVGLRAPALAPASRRPTLAGRRIDANGIGAGSARPADTSPCEPARPFG